eukprot:3149646-Rhodomonas_salina.2
MDCCAAVRLRGAGGCADGEAGTTQGSRSGAVIRRPRSRHEPERVAAEEATRRAREQSTGSQ